MTTVHAGPRVLNKRTDELHAAAIYVGRSKNPELGKWGNPYRVGKGEIGRQKAIDKYIKYIDRRISEGSLDVTELTGKDLVCWCAPRACHADYLLKIANPDLEREPQHENAGAHPRLETTMRVHSDNLLRAALFLTADTAPANSAWNCTVANDSLVFSRATGFYEYAVKVSGEGQIGPNMQTAFCIHDIRKSNLLSIEAGEGELEVHLSENLLRIGNVSADVVGLGQIEVSDFSVVALPDVWEARHTMREAAKEAPKYTAPGAWHRVYSGVHVARSGDFHFKIIAGDKIRICQFLLPAIILDGFEDSTVNSEFMAMASNLFDIRLSFQSTGLRISRNGTKFRFENDVGMITTDPIFGKYPNIQKLIPVDGYEFIVSPYTLKRVVADLKAFNKNALFLRLVPYKDSDGRCFLSVQTEDEDGGSANKTGLRASFDMDEEDMKRARIAISRRFLDAVIESVSMSGREILFMVNGTEFPVKITLHPSTTSSTNEETVFLLSPFGVQWE